MSNFNMRVGFIGHRNIVVVSGAASHGGLDEVIATSNLMMR